MLSKDTEERLAGVFAKYPFVEAVYAFGSAVSGKAGPEPDLDLAVLYSDDGDSPQRKLNLLSELVEAGFERVDLLTLNQADIVTRHEAVRLNKLIYRTHEFDRGGYYSKTVRAFADFRPYLERQRKTYKERMQ